LDNDFTADLRDIVTTIESSDVVVIRFITVGQRLLLDFRATELDGPLVKVVAPVKSVEERYRDLKELRPRFSLPDRIVAMWWPRFTTSLRTEGIWDVVARRVADSGHSQSVRDADRTFRELAALERQTQRDAIRGENFKTLWTAARAPRD
jgi:hypothetical protein